ncbi:MAG: alpha/beta hydrolase [Rhodobacteraceae bacterium]|nr:alpha/beta hydrolase [Paracoccaceae bacterium]
MEAAPLYNDVAEGPDGGVAYWLRCEDGLRIRMALWEAKEASGTVFMFPGRTEYVEKYGRAARDFAKRGLTTVAVDWRGQGLADRMLDNRHIGHVMRFRDYQMDVAAVVDAVRQLRLPKPWYLAAHSMGGCIGLRALIEGLEVDACAFSAPMWGVQLSPFERPMAWTLSSLLPVFGLGGIRSPRTQNGIYVLDQPFEDNTLTNDLEMWEYMGRQAKAHPELNLGSPSIKWLREALREMAFLSTQPSPQIPCVAFLGTNERIVELGRIRQRMAKWPGGRLIEFPDAEHEVIMEEPAIRARVFDESTAVFAGAA